MTARGSGRVRIPAEWAGERLDRALAAHLDIARNQVQNWTRAGRVRIDGTPVTKASSILAAGGLLDWSPPEPGDDRVSPESGDLVILHEDEHLVAVDKPAGLVVHPGAGRPTGTLVHRLLARYPELAGVGGPGRPGIVHRLDRETSGAMLVARTAEAYARLVRMFARREVDKRYLAIVWGVPKAARGTIEAPIGRHPHDRQRMAVVRAGRPAETRWHLLEAAEGAALLELELLTGRTHQIRVHVRHLGHPLVGDPVYGEARERNLRTPAARILGAFPRPALHAHRLTLAHPVSGARLEIAAPVASDLLALWREVTGRPWPER